MGDGGISGTCVPIETPDGKFDIKIRNINCCSVFRSELIAIYRGLKFIDIASDLVFRDIWILTESRAATQHLSQWTTVGDRSSLNILDVVVRLSSVYFQWVPSHIGLNDYEIVSSLATAEALRGDACLTFSQLSSIKRMELNALWRVPPTHPWYFGRKPRWYHQLNISQDRQTGSIVLFYWSHQLLLFNGAGKFFQSVTDARLIRPSRVKFLIF
ncbi:autophagy protein 5 [Trichonephila clavipes]|nr:autophagy protein 5 [Trichonephila clavipes]